MAYRLAVLMRWGVDPLWVYNLPRMRPDGTLPPPRNPSRLQAFYLAAVDALAEDESGVK